MRGFIFLENNRFVQFIAEISTIIRKFPQPWVAWVAHFSMSETLVLMISVSIFWVIRNRETINHQTF